MSHARTVALMSSSFYLGVDDSIDRNLIAFVRILLYDKDWIRFSQKGKLPSAALDKDIGTVLCSAIDRRISRYASSLKVGLWDWMGS